VGELRDATTLREFTTHAASVLPSTAWGVRAAGDPDRPVRTVAVCGGSGGGYAERARAAGADAYLTSDLKHHATNEAVAELGGEGMGLVDAAHWATEAPWLDVLAARLRTEFGTTVEVEVSRLRTDPWTLHIPSRDEGAR
jgi:putative NIF3 family GTP cyclohydrolase 1 type 2